MTSTLISISQACANPTRHNRVAELMRKPLIIGASVSADWAAPSPGKTLALRYTPIDEIRTMAQGGRPGRETLKVVRTKDFSDRSAIIGVDLFFWDSVFLSPKESLEALNNLMEEVKKRDLPIVLGEIPELLPGRQPGRAILNKSLTAACKGYEHCYIMPFDQLHKQVLSDGYLVMKGKKQYIKDIVPDGLHLSQTASEYLADTMRDILTP